MVNKTIKEAFKWFFDLSKKKGIPTNPEKNRKLTVKEKKVKQNSTHKLIYEGDSLFIEKLDAILEKHISDQKCKAKTIALDMAQSYESLNNYLKRTKDCTLSQYFRSYRMNKAKELLENSDKTISEICYYVGSSNLQTFSRSFKREFGKSPRELR